MKAVHHVLNECLIDRGSSPSMVSMECFIDGHHLTNIIVCPLKPSPAAAGALCPCFVAGCSHSELAVAALVSLTALQPYLRLFTLLAHLWLYYAGGWADHSYTLRIDSLQHVGR